MLGVCKHTSAPYGLHRHHPPYRSRRRTNIIHRIGSGHHPPYRTGSGHHPPYRTGSGHHPPYRTGSGHHPPYRTGSGHHPPYRTGSGHHPPYRYRRHARTAKVMHTQKACTETFHLLCLFVPLRIGQHVIREGIGVLELRLSPIRAACWVLIICY